MASCALTSSLSSVAASRGSPSRVFRVGARRPARGVVPAVTRAAMGPEMKGAIDKFVASNKIVVFMKGNKEAPRCGFSNTVVQIFKSMEVPFETVDILEDEGLRAGMKVYSDWPTFPQVYINGEFYGGCDICIDTYKDGTLKETVDVAMMS
jgi:monothiol glutaredoxin